MSTLDKGKMLKRVQRELDLGYQGERLKSIELVKMGEDGQVESIYDNWVAPNWPEVKDLVAEMDEKIEADLDSNKEPYTVYKFFFRYGTSSQPKNGPFVCRVRNTSYHDPEEAEMTALEGTSGKGLAVTAHRALIQYIGATVGERSEMTRLLRDMLNQANDRADRAEQRQFAFQRATEDLIDRSMERNLALKAAERMEGVKEQMLGMAMQFAPSAIGGFLEYMQKKGLGQGGDANAPQLPSRNDFLVKQFILNMTPEERHGLIVGLSGALGDARSLPMLEIMNGMKDEIAENDRRRGLAPPEVPQGTPTPPEEAPPPPPQPPPPDAPTEPPAPPPAPDLPPPAKRSSKKPAKKPGTKKPAKKRAKSKS
jgi:hypothetical protein